MPLLWRLVSGCEYVVSGYASYTESGVELCLEGEGIQVMNFLRLLHKDADLLTSFQFTPVQMFLELRLNSRKTDECRGIVIKNTPVTVFCKLRLFL